MGSSQDDTPSPAELSSIRRDPDFSAISVPVPSEPCSDYVSAGALRTITPSRAGAVKGSADVANGEILSGRYRVERRLGEGGMGVVYLVSDLQVAGETFAVKVLKESPTPEAVQSLREEVRKTRKLSHPNIVDVHSVNVDGDRLYVLMEYLEGKPLNELLDDEFGRGIPFSHAFGIIEDVCAALSYAHDHSIIHSDLKPANVFVTSIGRTKLLDFGIARASRGPRAEHRPALALTPAYASCEMLAGQDADCRDDVYSLACVIYEMLSGERPFSGMKASDARKASVRLRPLAKLTRRQNDALTRALAFDRHLRTASVEGLITGLSLGRGGGRNGRVIVVGAAIAAAAILVGLGYLSLRSNSIVVVRSMTGEIAQAANNPKSIAVVPFLNLVGGAEEYLADGLTTALIDRLTLFPGLSVTGQTSSFAVKTSKDDAPALGRRLHVEYLLEGTIRGSRDHLQVTTRLIRSADGFEIWSQHFERAGSAVQTLQDDIARAVVVDLHGSLIEIAPPTIPTTYSLEAYRLLLHADTLWRQAVATEDERQLIEAALQHDQGYADAWVRLGSWWYDAMLLGKVPTRDAVSEARAALGKALTINPDDSAAYVNLAWVQMSEHDWEGARQSAAKASSLDPANLRLLTLRGELLRSGAHWREAIQLEEQRQQRDPLSIGSKYALAQSYFCAGEYAAAGNMLKEAVLENPRYPIAHALLGRTLAAQGDKVGAAQMAAAEPDEAMRLASLAVIQFDLKQFDDSQLQLARLRSQYGETLPGLVGLAYAYQLNLDSAFEWLQRAVTSRQPEFATSLACTPEPSFAALMADSRFPALRASLGRLQ